eukprot:388135-Pyramimonas_sp.AAC.1
MNTAVSSSSTPTVSKRRKQFEKHFDDCGQDWSGLGKDALMTTGFSSEGDDGTEDSLEEEWSNHQDYEYFEPYWFAGMKEVPHCEMRTTPFAHIFNTMEAMDILQSSMHDVEFDVCDIAGGQARTSIIMVSEQKACLRYRAARGVRIVIMSPICGSFGSWSYMNRQLYPDTWQESLECALKLSTFCAAVALAQYGDGRDWLNEQPTSSDMYTYDPWPKVREHPRTVAGNFHMCQMGARATDGGHVNKPTSIWASGYDLIYY